MTIREQIQKKASQLIVSNNFNDIYELAPRTGKSKIVLEALNSLNKKVLIIVPYNSIIDSWNNEIVKWKHDLTKTPITLINQRSLNKVNKGEFDIICSDEIHTLSNNQMEELKRIGIKPFGITGSLSKDTEKELKLQLGLKVNFRYSLEEAINDKIISDYSINVITCNLNQTDKTITGGNKKKSFLTTEFDHYNYLTSQFNRFKVLAWQDSKFENVKMNFARLRASLLYTCPTKLEIAKKLISKYKRCLVFTTLTDVADKLCENSYHSKSNGDELDNFLTGKIDKLATVSMLNMGITFSDLKQAVCHQLQSSEELSVQKLLRTMNFDLGKDANIDIIVVNNTVDEQWLNKALLPFDKKKIKYIDSRNLKT